MITSVAKINKGFHRGSKKQGWSLIDRYAEKINQIESQPKQNQRDRKTYGLFRGHKLISLSEIQGSVKRETWLEKQVGATLRRELQDRCVILLIRGGQCGVTEGFCKGAVCSVLA